MKNPVKNPGVLPQLMETRVVMPGNTIWAATPQVRLAPFGFFKTPGEVEKWRWMMFGWFFIVDDYRSLGIQSYSQLMIGVSNHLLSIVFRFHYHSQKVIGSLGDSILIFAGCFLVFFVVEAFEFVFMCWILEKTLLLVMYNRLDSPSLILMMGFAMMV